MKAPEFARKITKLTPTRQALLQSKTPIPLIDSILKMYAFKCSKSPKPYSGEITNLTKNYINQKSVEIFGGINLIQAIKEDEYYIYFGRIELDPIVVNKNIGTIEYLEYQTYWLFSKVAKSEEHFLDVLYRIYEAFTDRITGKKYHAKTLANELTELSGEPLSINFYKTILGAHD